MNELFSDLLAFEPVASATNRHDGWTPEKQKRFIHELSRIGLVSAAARAVGMSPKSAYALRKRAPAESGFARAWDAALARRGARLFDCDRPGAGRRRCPLFLWRAPARVPPRL